MALDEKITTVTSNTAAREPEFGEVKQLHLARDIGAELYQEVQQCDQEELRLEWDAVRRKVDLRILPLVREPPQNRRITRPGTD